ncbi:non-homologous end joining protein Ku [Pseudokineococcus sp. 1T1Z-3]|uniref:non-homologous end joining protein Ku n=1 Tax=Pseudokineococcus sp. 1T1Z-3 TaxID=3132745 RepID=UPI0030A55E66
MRAIWKGAVSFGLVSVPVKVYAATGTKDLRFHQVHEADGGRIRYKRVCSVDGEEVSYPEIAKAYETADGEQVVLSDGDLDELPLSTSREIGVVEFVPREQVDPVLYNKAYYLEPEKTALKPYTLLREALAETDRVAVVKVALRQRESLALLRVRDDVICLQTLLWPDEVREASFDVLGGEVELRPQERQMAASLVESLAADFDPDAFTDDYATAVAEMVEAKISAGEVSRPPAQDDADGEGGGAQVVDLLSALQRSVARARQDRGEAGDEGGDAEPGSASAEGPATEDTAAKSTPAKSSRAKGTAAKGSSGSGSSPKAKSSGRASSTSSKRSAKQEKEEAPDAGATPPRRTRSKKSA